MYKSWTANLSLQDVLEKLAAKKAGLPIPTPVTTIYAKSDRTRASKVLARLQKLEVGREVSHITHPVNECNE